MEPEDFLYTMSRDVNEAEMHRKTPKWEMLLYLVLLGGMFAAEILIMNPR